MSEEPGSDLQSARVLVSLATYNEQANVQQIVDAVHEALPAADVLVVDDNSPDGTGRIADELARDRPWLHVEHRAGKLGLGTALLHAMKYAADRGYTFWINMDADFSHPPRYLPDLVAGMQQYDVMIGSRYIPGGGIEGWDARRKFMSWCINVYTRILLGLKARDCSGSFRCYRLAKVAGVDRAEIYSTGYSFMEEFLFHCARAGCRIGETPIVFVNRKIGKSKIDSREIVKAIWALTYTGLRYFMRPKAPVAA